MFTSQGRMAYLLAAKSPPLMAILRGGGFVVWEVEVLGFDHERDVTFRLSVVD